MFQKLAVSPDSGRARILTAAASTTRTMLRIQVRTPEICNQTQWREL